MSPSTHQSGNSGEYRNEPHKMLTTKDDTTLLALVRGIESEGRARVWLGECNRLGVGGEVKSRVVGRVRELSD